MTFMHSKIYGNLSKNRFSEVPSEICEYESLEKIHLYHNVIKSLPDQLANLQSLSHLILSRNQLSVLPSCVCQLSSLQVLDVSGNRLVSLPEELGLLARLTDLDASYNQLQVLPPSLGDLDDLRRLRLQLCFLRLVCLDLSYNRISSLPTELRFMSSLLDLLLEANPLSHPPANVCMRGRVHIFKWLDQSAAKEDKKRGVLSEVEFRKTRKYTKMPPVSDFSLTRKGGRTDLVRMGRSFDSLLKAEEPKAFSSRRSVFLPSKICAVREKRFSENIKHVSFSSSSLDSSSSNDIMTNRISEHSTVNSDRKSSDVVNANFRILLASLLLISFTFVSLFDVMENDLPKLVNGFLDGRHKRSTVDSGYSTSENGDNRWSHGSQELCDSLRSNMDPNKDYHHSKLDRPTRNGVSTLLSGSNSISNYSASHTNGILRMDSSSSEHTLSGHSTPSTLSPGESFNLEDEFYKAMKLRQEISNSNANQNIEEPFDTQSPMGPAPFLPSRKRSPVDPTSFSSAPTPSTSMANGHPMSFLPPTEHPHPHNPDPGGGVAPSPLSPHPQVPTYREYLEAKRQQRAIEANNIYKRHGADGSSSPISEVPTPRHSVNGTYPAQRPNPMGASNNSKPIPNGPLGGSHSRPTDLRDENARELTRAHVKSIQKEAVLSYVKSRVSPTKSSSSPNSPNTSFDSADTSFHSQTVHSPYSISGTPTMGYLTSSSPQSSSTPYTGTNGSGLRNGMVGRGSTPTPMGVLKTRKRSGGGQPFDPDSAPSRLNFTYRRELEKQQHEKQLIDNLRGIIETRLKVSLPSDLSSALMDGVVLCHLVNHVRPRAVASIHVPSPAVPKLTIAKCRLNVENFLEACRKIGVEEASLCSCDDIVTAFAPDRLLATLRSLLYPCEAPTSSTPTSLDSDTISTTVTNITLTQVHSSTAKDLPANINSEAVTNIDMGEVIAKEGHGKFIDTSTLRKRSKGGDERSESFPLDTKGRSLDTEEIVEEGKYLSFILLSTSVPPTMFLKKGEPSELPSQSNVFYISIKDDTLRQEETKRQCEKSKRNITRFKYQFTYLIVGLGLLLIRSRFHSKDFFPPENV
ncbi:Leucine-rich repeat and calponin homology domain-containing protein 1 [Armadillidium vulgare]|nr:Leucine-rich repeat and calponin homology domain-containing protein 1 [Armadillidium vulgare]